MRHRERERERSGMATERSTDRSIGAGVIARNETFGSRGKRSGSIFSGVRVRVRPAYRKLQPKNLAIVYRSASPEFVFKVPIWLKCAGGFIMRKRAGANRPVALARDRRLELSPYKSATARPAKLPRNIGEPVLVSVRRCIYLAEN